MSSVIFFDNDMQDCVIKLRKWYRTAVAEGFLCFFLRKLAEAQMLCKCYVIIFFISSILWMPHLTILAMRSCPFRTLGNTGIAC